jgi:hypothetical protein
MGAKCDGVSDDSAAIQKAFDAAINPAQPVTFPSGICYAGRTIVYRGQSFYGEGQGGSIIRGAPGKDVFQTLEPTAPNAGIPNGTYIHDINIQVDSSVDASANFPGRNWSVGQGITASVGNCGFAFPDTDGSPSDWSNPYASGLRHATIARVTIMNVGGAGESNHTCAFFMQMEPYSTTFEDLTVTQLYYGYVEHLPTINSAARAFAPDDNIFRNVSLTTHIGFIAYDGEYDLVEGLQVYASNVGDLCFFLLSAPSLNRTQPYGWSIAQMFMEPNSSTSAVVDWITGQYHVFTSAALSSGGSNVVLWQATNSKTLEIYTAGTELTH